MSGFIFRGRHERLKLDELENPRNRGGLGLVCVATKAECLLLRQTLWILSRTESNCFKHISFWLGYQLQEYFAEITVSGPICLASFPLHKHIFTALEEGLVRQDFKPNLLDSATCKAIYASRAADIIPPPKVELKFPEVNYLELVYPCLNNKILEAEPRDALYCMVHNLHPNRKRLHQQGRAKNPCCPLPKCQGMVQDREHLFSSCYLVSQAWLWLRPKLLQLLPTTIGAVAISSEDFLLLRFPKDTMDKELVWIIGNFCDIFLKVVIAKKPRLSANLMSSLMKSRFHPLKHRAVVQPHIYFV